MNGFRFLCPFCGETVDPLDSNTWRRVQGWEHKAKGVTRKSGSDIALREPVEAYAHNGCIVLAKSGLSAHQAGLFE